jgi:hypothetical protein
LKGVDVVFERRYRLNADINLSDVLAILEVLMLQADSR